MHKTSEHPCYKKGHIFLLYKCLKTEKLQRKQFPFNPLLSKIEPLHQTQHNSIKNAIFCCCFTDKYNFAQWIFQFPPRAIITSKKKLSSSTHQYH